MDGIAEIDVGSPWHGGELAIQQRAGVVEQMAAVGRRNIRDHLTEQHRTFYPQLPFIVAGAVDPAGRAWATILASKPGFLKSPDPARLRVTALRNPFDPADAGLGDGDAVGLLGIELHSRRRNRLNGSIRRVGATGFDVTVAESYGNCPQYIQLRDFGFTRDPAEPPAETVQTLDSLDGRPRAMIAEADTLFIASYIDREDGRRQVDVSHRGGKPGFVHLDESGTITIPDFAGNLFFNTLGNILINPKCGLVFVDFETGDMLQLTGDGTVALEAPEIAAFQGAERLLRFVPRRIVFRPGALPLRWTYRPGGASPSALMTGNWGDAAARMRAAGLASTWRKFRVAGIVEESSVIRSIQLEPLDGAGLVLHRAGQHLPLRLTLPGSDTPVIRTYTLSSAPSDGFYRISVKRQGAVSRLLHGLNPGDLVEARGPAGGFTIDARATRPAVLVAAGVGVTPMLAMLRHLVYEGLRTRRIRPTFFFHAAHSKAERAFDVEIEALREAARGAVRVIRVLSDVSGAARDLDYDFRGRIGIDLLQATLPLDDDDFYLCGPAAFMQDLYDGLRGLNVADNRIHAEAFGPAALKRITERATPARPPLLREPARIPVTVSFAASGKRARWTDASGSLLDLAEAEGLTPPFSCRAGTCGTCRTRILQGSVSYATSPTAEIAEDEALICCAVPSGESGGASSLSLDL